MRKLMRHLSLGTVAALTVSLLFCGQAAAFVVGGMEFADTWTDDFDDGLTSGWSRVNHSESGGKLTMWTGDKDRSQTENYSASFAGATEWAYKFSVSVPNFTITSARLATLFLANDVGLYAYRVNSSTFQIWAGNTYYQNGTFYWKSGDYSMGPPYEIGIHKQDGVNLYDIYVNGSLATSSASNTYDGSEVPTQVLIGSESGAVYNYGAVYDYIYAGTPPVVPEPASAAIALFGIGGMLCRRRNRR